MEDDNIELSEITFDNMIGRVMTKVENLGDDELRFTSGDGALFRFLHYQSCCESVLIDDIVGDLEDLVGLPIVQAEEVGTKTGPASECGTWTFYKFATAKGSVSVRWLGTSNGYYSESVDFVEYIPKAAS